MKGDERTRKKNREKSTQASRKHIRLTKRVRVTLQTILCDESKESCLAGCKKAHKHEAFVCIFICKWMINQESFVRRSCARSCFLRSFSVLDTDGRLLELGKEFRRSLFVFIIFWFLYFLCETWCCVMQSLARGYLHMRPHMSRSRRAPLHSSRSCRDEC